MFVEKTQRCLLNDILRRTQTVIENSWDAKDTYIYSLIHLLALPIRNSTKSIISAGPYQISPTRF